jgi:hypothetical protein
MRDRCIIGLLGGYSYHEQNMRLTNGVLLLSNSTPVNIPINGLNSTYESSWQGPFAAVDLELHASPHFSILGTAEYHWPDYEGEANWNLNTNFAHPVSFRHEADTGEGVIGALKGSYLVGNGWELDLTFEYRDFSVSDGIARTFLADGSFLTTKLNEANWQSSAFTIGFTYRFK